MKIVALGTSCVDIYPQTGAVTPGGEALNIAVHLSMRADTSVYLMGMIGTDEFASTVLDSVARFNANRDHLYQAPGETAHHVIHISEDGDRYFEEGSWHGGVSGNFRFSEVDRSLLAEADGVITTLWEPNLRELVALKERSRYLIAVDFNVQRDLEEWEDVIEDIDIFFSGAYETMVDVIRARSFASGSVFVLTHGERGSTAFHRGTRYDSAAVTVNKVVDTTGCGDCYQGVFLREYLETGDIQRSMDAASLAASGVTAYVGGFPSHG